MPPPRNGRSNGSTNGVPSGDDQRDRALTLPEFVAICGENRSALKPQATVLRAAVDGRPGGATLGRIDLDPLQTLEERLEDAYPGHHTLRVMARTTGGHYAACGELALATGAPTQAGGAVGDPLMRELLAEMRASRAAPAQSPLAAITEMAAALKALQGSGPSLVDQLSAMKEQAQLMREMAKDMGRQQSQPVTLELVKEGLKYVGQPLGEIFTASAALLVQRVAERHEAQEQREAQAAGKATVSVVETKP